MNQVVQVDVDMGELRLLVPFEDVAGWRSATGTVAGSTGRCGLWSARKVCLTGGGNYSQELSPLSLKTSFSTGVVLFARNFSSSLRRALKSVARRISPPVWKRRSLLR